VRRRGAPPAEIWTWRISLVQGHRTQAAGGAATTERASSRHRPRRRRNRIVDALNILSGFDLHGVDSATRKHLVIEAMRRAIATGAVSGRPDFVSMPAEAAHQPGLRVGAARQHSHRQGHAERHAAGEWAPRRWACRPLIFPCWTRPEIGSRERSDQTCSSVRATCRRRHGVPAERSNG